MGILAGDVDRRRVAAQLLAVVLVGGAVLWAVYRFAPFLYDPDALRAVVRDAGPLAPIVFVLLQALQVVVAPIPGQLTAVAGGFLFGWPGLLYSLVGVTLGSVVAFWLSRRLGRPYVETVLDEDTLARIDAALSGTGDVVVAVFFLVPGLPDDVICFVAGLSSIDIRKFVLVSVLARSPAYVLATFVGSSVALGELRVALVALAAFGGLSVLGYRYRDAILDRFGARRA
jgi:uncharacterized membrane protein YdjX (TVP38/TMEM64 family)